jgi:hypothetical protein
MRVKMVYLPLLAIIFALTFINLISPVTALKCPWPPPLRLPKKEGAIKQRMDEPCRLLGLSISIYALGEGMEDLK